MVKQAVIGVAGIVLAYVCVVILVDVVLAVVDALAGIFQ